MRRLSNTSMATCPISSLGTWIVVNAGVTILWWDI